PSSQSESPAVSLALDAMSTHARSDIDLVQPLQKGALLAGARAVATAAVARVFRVEWVVVIRVGGSVGISVIGSIVVSIVEAHVRIAKSASCVINSQISAAIRITK